MSLVMLMLLLSCSLLVEELAWFRHAGDLPPSVLIVLD